MDIIRLSRQFFLLLAMVLLFLGSASARTGPMPWVSIAELPVEARQTVVLIRQGGPFPYEKDGTVFNNFERLLPRQPRGYYREFTVPTPRRKHRGARRIVVGGKPEASTEMYYTDDHYQSFRRIRQ